MKKILVTGAAGFIGYHLIKNLIDQENNQVVGLDIINDYYDVELKYDRLRESGLSIDEIEYNQLLSSKLHPNYRFIKMDLLDKINLQNLFELERFDFVVNLAAQVGIRYSLYNPEAYLNSNLLGFLNVLEACRNYPVKHLIFASSSSVYGANKKVPFTEEDTVDNPISFYAVTKKANELMAHSYSHLFGIPCTGLRFFTVYGPWGRPDMAYFIFTSAIINNKPIKLNNGGNMSRDFTYIDDVIDGIIRVMYNYPTQNHQNVNSISKAQLQIFNIGNNNPSNIESVVEIIENNLNKKAIKEYQDIQPGDVESTFADISRIKGITGFSVKVNIKDGLKRFIDWYLDYYDKKR